jgi:hypothetical protein
VIDIHKAKYRLIRSVWESSTANIAKPIDEDYQEVLSGMHACGKRCKACHFKDFSQSTVISSLTTCKSMATIANTLNQHVFDQVQQTLSNNQDMLAPLATMLGASSTQSVVYNVSNRITTKITNQVISSITNTISNNQNIVVDSGIVTTVTQQSAYNSVLHFLSKTQIFNSIFTDEQWKLIQASYNEQNTIDTLGNATVKEISTFSKMITSIMGKIVFFMFVLVAAIVFFIVLYVVYLAIKKSVVAGSKAANSIKIKSAKLSAFTQF